LGLVDYTITDKAGVMTCSTIADVNVVLKYEDGTLEHSLNSHIQ